LDPIAIRNILNKVNVLTESTGLAGRKPGAVFTDSQTDETLTFVDLKFFPEEGGKFSQDDLTKAVAHVESELGMPIEWENSKGPRTGGFGIATFTKDDGSQLAVGTYLQEVKPIATQNYISNTVLGRYKFAGKAAAKTQAGLTPQDLLTERNNLTIAKIMNQLASKLGTDDPLYYVAHHVALGQPLPFEFDAPEGQSFTAFRDYFCEILQPIALQKGLYSGNAGEAAEIFLGGDGFESTRINFDSAKNAGLSDSILDRPDGKYVKVSSKGDKGAEASAKNLINSVDELAETDRGKKLLNKYKDTIELVREIQTQGQSGAPLYLGVKFKIITDEDANTVRKMKNAAPVNINDKKQLKELGLSDTLIKLASERGTKTPDRTSLFYHLIAAIAHKAADAVNDKTNFSDAAADILNNGALVQVYTKAKEKNGKWILEGFDTVYPGTSVSGVVLSAGKNYASTGIKGNFTFKILRGNAKAVPDDDTEETPTVDVEPEVRAPGERVATTRGTKAKGGAGRELR
jgi:hypothetical protein